MENLQRVARLARGYRFASDGRVPGYGHVVGPAFGQVYRAEKIVDGIIVDARGVGVGHFLQKHADAVAV
jgi:hypothetical protein